jgi:dipeptidyl aminopeptidase/acylaminoacyl peptidase
VKPTDLSLMSLPGAPALSPDGRFAVVALRRVDFDADDYTSHLWLVPVDAAAGTAAAGGGAEAAPVPQARQLTYGWNDGAPRVSPDGRWLAFLRSNRDRSGSRAGGVKSDFGDSPQLCVMPLDGGEPRRLTDHPLGAGTPAWSPDSTRLAYATRVPQQGRYGTGLDAFGDKVPANGEPPRRITSLLYRRDDLGFLSDRPSQVFVVALDGTPVQVTEGDFDNGDPSWSPDGEWLTFPAARHASHRDDLAKDVWVVRPDGTDLRALTDTTLSIGQPRFTPDGSAVVFVGHTAGKERLDPVIRNQFLWSVPVAGGPARPLLDPERYNLVSPTGEIVVSETGVLFPNEHRGAGQLLRVPFDGGQPEVLFGGERSVLGVASAGDLVVVTAASPTTWGDLYVCGAVEPPGARPSDASASSGAASVERRLTDWSAAYRAAVPVHKQEEITATAPDGYPVHGWVVRPSTAGPHPVLLMIHGGPFSQYGWHLFDEAQVYAGAGYAVVMGNPRGSSGYGEAHGRAIVGDVGRLSSVDLLALLDAAVKAPDLDESRTGVLGGSHGGFMTTWLAGRHGSRFRAAISERAVNAIDSFTGSSDIGWFFADAVYGEDLSAQSPLSYAHQIDIPMLIIHSEQDWRCPVEQAQRLYVALKRRGAQVEMLLFPGEGHELSRSGRPSHRVARFEAILDWFARWL